MTATNSSATVKGGLFETNGVATLTGIRGKSSWRRYVSIIMNKKSMLGIRQKMFALTGAATGGSASKTLGRVQASSELGGARTIESETIVSTNTDAADVTEIKADFLGQTSLSTFGASPPANKDLNPLGTR
jgi:hypothetical protein